MNIFKLLFELFLLYMAYKLIFEFIIPLYKTTKDVKQKVADMQQKMAEQQRQAQSAQAHKTAPKKETSIGGDYIDYEEVK